MVQFEVVARLHLDLAQAVLVERERDGLGFGASHEFELFANARDEWVRLEIRRVVRPVLLQTLGTPYERVGTIA